MHYLHAKSIHDKNMFKVIRGDSQYRRKRTNFYDLLLENRGTGNCLYRDTLIENS